MAEQTSSSITIDAAPTEVMAVIADFERYPEWAGEVKQAEVLDTDADGRPEQVRMVLDGGGLKDDYVLRYTWSGESEVRWTLVKAQLLRALDGSYALRPLAGGKQTEVTYQLVVDLKIPMFGMLKRKVEKVIIDRALPGLKARVESVTGSAG
ncbi:SRPBCC family protein [Streptomyces sp. NPDC051940]|uniref:SRPBCC family protein n=1 Tax=Streptomyces sp. NPDC051940 TaxID=3155675 RepID=UPI0034283A2A